jgi:hypothetical protein
VTRKPPRKGETHAERIRHEGGAAATEPPDAAASPSGPHDDDEFGWDFLTPTEIREWAQREIREAARALDLRARELFDLVEAYSSGKISAEKADELQSRYLHRWGEALPGVVQGDIGDPPLSDERILAKVDSSNRLPFIKPRDAWERARQGRTNPRGGTSR